MRSISSARRTVAWYVASDIFGHYDKSRYFGVRNLILALVDQALPQPLVRARSERPVEVSVRRRADGVLICHLVNLTVKGMNNATETQYASVARNGPVEVALPSFHTRPGRGDGKRRDRTGIT